MSNLEAATEIQSAPEVLVPRMVAIPGGRHETCAGDGERRIAEILPFFLGATPVTNREYAPFVVSGRAAPPPWWNDPRFCAPLQPVAGVTWDDARAYCDWLGESAGGRWRLPTEEEWEWAACGGLSAPATAWGERLPEGEIPEGRLDGPWETGRGTPNGYGLLDMSTIVHEWCANRREAGRPDLPHRRAARGGSWRHKIRWSAPSAHSSLPPHFRYSDFGFRVLREIDGWRGEVT